MKKILGLFAALAGLALVLSITQTSAARALQYAPETQTSALFYDEARTVYLGNLERRAHGLGPLRWNKEMTLAARWFSWDSVENRPGGFCGHDDTLGRAPWDRMALFGYPGFGGAENAYCGYMTPEAAIAGWMDSPGHRDNLLTAGWREIGLGYYRQGGDGRGYITQDFGVDGVYPPLVIGNEAPNTTSPQVPLYIYNAQGSGGLTDLGPAVNMMVSNNACFIGASWQAYQTEPTWTLPAGEGWKNVYSQIKDRLGRTARASDSIYLGANIPTEEISFAQTSQNSDRVTLYNLNGNGMPNAQFSLGWVHDDANFGFLWGKGAKISDAAAMGGTTYQLEPADMESSAWVYTADFIADAPMVAYFRLKTSSNSSASEVARVQVEANEVKQTRGIQGTEFTAASQYQEFSIPFTYHRNPDKPFLIFQFSRTGSATISVDAVTIFTASQALSGPTYTWNVPGRHYRGQGIWVRFANNSGGFSGFQEAETTPVFGASAQQITHLALPEQTSRHMLLSASTCDGSAWSVSSKPAWLQSSQTGNTLEVWGDASGMGLGTYPGDLILRMGSTGTNLTLPVKLVVVNTIHDVFLPVTTK